MISETTTADGYTIKVWRGPMTGNYVVKVTAPGGDAVASSRLTPEHAIEAGEQFVAEMRAAASAAAG